MKGALLEASKEIDIHMLKPKQEAILLFLEGYDTVHMSLRIPSHALGMESSLSTEFCHLCSTK